MEKPFNCIKPLHLRIIFKSIIIKRKLFLHFRTKLQRPEINEGQLLEILRQKDSQIVGLESMDREKQRELDLKQSELDKLQEEMNVYKDLIDVSNSFSHLHQLLIRSYSMSYVLVNL